MGKMVSLWTFLVCRCICFELNAPPNNLITEHMPNLAPEFHSFSKWAIRNELLQKINKVFYRKLPKVYSCKKFILASGKLTKGH